MIYLAQGIHLLHVLPAAATKNTWPGFEHLDVVKPKLSSMNIQTDRSEDELVSLCDGLAVLPILVSGKVKAATDEVDVSRVDAEPLR